MRTLVAAILTLALTVPVMAQEKAQMPLTIGAGSTGYGVTAMDKGEHFTNYWAGARGYEVSEYTAIYATYQHVGQTGGNGGHGLKALLVSGSPKTSWLYLMADLGVAFNLAENTDGSEAAAFTAGGGVAAAVTEYISPFVYVSTYDAGPNFSWAIHFGFAITDIQKIVRRGE